VGPTLRPQIQRRLRPRLRPTNDSWRVDETYIRVKGSGCIYTGLSTPEVRRSTSFCRLNATQQRRERFLAKALGGETIPVPRVINSDEQAGYPPAIERLKAEGALGENLPALNRCSTTIMFGTGSPSHPTPGAREPTFTFILGSLAYDRRL
jgi:transposase-like protein